MSFNNILTQLQEEQLWEMSNFRPKDTNLPMNIYISTGEVEGKKMKHSARIKVGRTYAHTFNPFDTFSVTISDNPQVVGDTGEIRSKDIKKAIKFVKINIDVLEAYWDGEYSSADLVHNLIKLESRK